jgi:hypothetical protein
MPVRVPWTSVSFLLYAGGLTILVSSLFLLSALAGDYGAAAFAGWSLLVFAVLAACAFALRRAGRVVAAGLFATASVAAFTYFLTALEHWFGWLHDTDSAFGGFRWGLLLVELGALVAALVALRRFRFPLLVLAAAAVGWFFVTDLLSGGGDWSATVTILVGLVFLLTAFAVNPIYGFWLHVAAGLTIGGALLWFWHTSDWDWIFVAIAGLVFVWFGGVVGRSSWVVLGAFGLFLSTTHWVDKWFGFPNPLLLFYGFGESDQTDRPWARALSYVVLGVVFMLLGFLLERRRRAEPLAQ